MTAGWNRWVVFIPVLVAGCSSAPQPPDWQLNAAQALQAFEARYLRGDTPGAELEFNEAMRNIRSTGRGDLVARAELVRCAARTASLEIDDCPGFHAVRDLAAKDELAYADYLAGKGAHKGDGSPLSRLVGLGVSFRNTSISPAEIQSAVDLASAQGWRRPLLAWLGVQLKRAEAAGDGEMAARIRRRMDLVSG